MVCIRYFINISFSEPVTVGGCEGSNEERYSESIGDLGEGNKDTARAHSSASHQPRGHARLHGQPCLRLRRYGGKHTLCIYCTLNFTFVT